MYYEKHVIFNFTITKKPLPVSTALSILLLSGYCLNDCWQRCVRTLSRRSELHADRQLGAEETGLPIPDELRQVSARHGYYGCQYICQGMYHGIVCS